MRLPGKGYESINALHPDQFGDYGAFDRFKILSDIAPNSSEYKRWKNIAKATTTDPDLAADIKKITERTVKMSGNHEFFNYKFLHSKTKYSEGIIKSIGEDGTINLSDDTILTLSGLTLNPGANYDLAEMITPGSKITYRTNRNRQYDKQNNINNVSAIIYQHGNANSVNKQLLDSNMAEVDVEDNSTLASLAKLSPVQEFSGAIQEAFAHAPIPMLHNKFLRVESARESYMNETYYGSNFKTWDHPVKSFITPMFNKQSGKSLASEALSLGIAYNHFHHVLKGSAGNRGFVVNGIEKAFGQHFKQSTLKTMSNIALVTTNPTAFFGGNAMYILHMSNGGKGKGNDLTNWQRGAKWGTIAGTVKYAWDNADNPLKSAGGMAMAGFMLGGQTNFGWELLEKSLGKMNARKGAVIGAGIGLAMSAIKNPGMDKQKMFNGWAPKATRKKWDIDEYFDRLTYIKYSGLYEEASRRARRFEHVDVKGLFKDIDKNKAKVSKLNIKATKLAAKQKTGHDKYAKEIQKIEEKKMYLEEQVTMFYKGGKYTDAAIAYKKKMESTMYGIDGAASKDEILAAVPQQYKDFYSSFVDETDPKERKKILKSMSPIMRRPLQAAWGMELEDIKSNRRYFGVHAMPNSGWRGWKPNANLKHVKMKTIQNEGMLLSDFGYYDSEKAKSNYEDAPDIDHYDKGSGIARMHEMRQALRGSGLHLQNVSVDTTSAPGTWIFSDIKERTSEYARVGGYEVGKALSSLF